MTYAAAHVLETKKGERKKNWMTLEILELMEERKLAKNIPAELGTERYKELKNKVQNECRKAKEKFLNEECREIERLQEINSAAYHKKKKIKEQASQEGKKISECLKGERRRNI